MTQEKIDTNMKDIKKKTKNASLEDIKKGWRQKLLHGKYPLSPDYTDVNKATIHQWASNSSLKGETAGFILTAQDLSIPHGYIKQESFKMVLTLILDYAQNRKKQ